MLTHQLAKFLLERPNVKVCITQVDRKNKLLMVSELQMFEAPRSKTECIVIVAEGQKITGDIYWHGDQPYLPAESEYQKRNQR